MSDIEDAITRLSGNYYNSQPVSAGNPGGLAADGHVTNFPAALADLGLVSSAMQSWVALLGGDELTQVAAFDVQKADRFSGDILIADDAVGSITPSSNSGLLIAYFYQADVPQVHTSVLCMFDVGLSTDGYAVHTGTAGHFALAAPTGTSAPDGYLGVFLDNGQIHFNNRFGSARTVRYTYLG